jgi:hypothetical protein
VAKEVQTRFAISPIRRTLPPWTSSSSQGWTPSWLASQWLRRASSRAGKRLSGPSPRTTLPLPFGSGWSEAKSASGSAVTMSKNSSK